MNQTIQTVQVDQYTQTILTDRTLSTDQRADSAAAAIYMHVMAEFGLPFGTELPMTDDDQERAFWVETSLAHTHQNIADLITRKSRAGLLWIGKEGEEGCDLMEWLTAETTADPVETLALAEEVMAEPGRDDSLWPTIPTDRRLIVLPKIDDDLDDDEEEA